MRRELIKPIAGVVLALGLPIGSALGYMQWRADSIQAAYDRYDRDHALVYTIPAGSSKTFTPIDDQALDLPDVITLTLGAQDTLLVKNADGDSARAGPFKIAGGGFYRQQFQQPGKFSFVCDVDAADSLMVVVEPAKP